MLLAAAHANCRGVDRPGHGDDVLTLDRIVLDDQDGFGTVAGTIGCNHLG